MAEKESESVDNRVTDQERELASNALTEFTKYDFLFDETTLMCYNLKMFQRKLLNLPPIPFQTRK